MYKKAIFFDLDNTIYPVAAIGEKLFQPLFELIAKSGEFKGDLEDLKASTMRKPFQHVAAQYQMSDLLKERAMRLLHNLTYNEAIDVFPDYEAIRQLPLQKFLVTAGFTKLQFSKIYQLGIENDFTEIYVVDQTKSNDTKRSVFSGIMQSHQYSPKDILVVGDDPESELKAAKELNIDAVLYDSLRMYDQTVDLPRITDFKELEVYLN